VNVRVLLIALALLFAVPAHAAKWHPKHQWQTLQTVHFDVHFHEGLAETGIEMARVAEEVHSILSPYLEWEPLERTQVVLLDSTDRANGYATPVPYNTIVLYMVQPTPSSSLDNYENWLWAIFVHEYTHTLQIDMVSGLPLAVRALLGRYVVPNAVLPLWMTEGYATWLETFFTTGGRGRSTYTDMMLRTATLTRTLPAIDQAEGTVHTWPGGSLRYLYGARFHLHVSKQAGDRAWVDFHQRHGAGPIPFYLPAREAFGKTVSRMWSEWKVELAEHYLEQADRIRREGSGVTATSVVPTKKGTAYRPRYDHDGDSILYLHASAFEGSALRRIRRDGRSDTKERKGSAPELVRSPDGERFFYSGTATYNRWESFRDLYRFKPGAKRARRLTRGDRLSYPAPHPDGWLLAVQTGQLSTQLVRVDLEERDDLGAVLSPLVITPLTAAEDGTHYATPVWDAAGERLAVSVWKPGGFRDIHIFDQQLQLLRVVTWDRAGDTDPTWSPDGRWLVWASDRDDVWNLYAYRWSDGAVRRLTRLLGGATSPDISPDGEHIVFQGYGPTGPRVEEMPFAPQRAETVTLDARALPGPGWGPSAQAIAPVHPLEGVPGPTMPWGSGPADAVARARTKLAYTTLTPGASDALAEPPEAGEPLEEAKPTSESSDGVDLEGEPKRLLSPEEKRTQRANLAERQAQRRAKRRERNRRGPKLELAEVPAEVGVIKRYNPIPTLFPPRVIEPFGAITNGGAIGGLRIGGSDILGHHAWSGSLHYRTDSKSFGFGVGYSFAQFRPRFSIDFTSVALNYGTLFLRTKPAGTGTTFPGIYRGEDRYYERRDRARAGVSVQMGNRSTFSARYKFEFRRPLDDLPTDVATETLPARGSFSGLTLGFTTGSIGRYSGSISAENSELLSLSADLESSFLGAWRVEADGSRSTLHRLILTAEARKYIALPWAKGHVLAVRGAVGGTIGTDIPQKTFRLGGPYGDSPFVSLPDRYYGLRGYPTSFARGNNMYLGSMEYRLPLFLIERGPFTVPVFFRSIALTVYVEAGQAFDTADYAGFGGSSEGFLNFWSNTSVSFGAELVGEVRLAWAGSFQGRVGYGYGIGAGAYPSGILYAQLGTSF
jgi:hypothetical protein